MSSVARIRYGSDAPVRKRQDLERAQKEQASARSLDRSQIGSGGTLKVDGTLEVDGDLVVPAGSLTSPGGSMSAGVDVVAGRDVNATRDVNAGRNLNASGSAHVSGTLTADAGISSSGVQANDLSAAGGGSKIVYINNTSKQMGFLTSSRRFKQDISRATGDIEKLRAIHVYLFRYREAVALHPDDAVVWIGAMAEDLHAAGYTQLVEYDDEGNPFGLQMQLMWVIPHLFAEALDERVSSLEDRIAALEH